MADLEIQDFLGFPISDTLEIDAFSPYTSWRHKETKTIDAGKLSIQWHFYHWPIMLFLSVKTKHKRGTQILVLPHLKPQNLAFALDEYQKKRLAHLPISFSSFTKKPLNFSFSKAQKEIVFALQPMQNVCIEIERFEDISVEKKLTFSPESSLAGLYLGTSRFLLDHLYQNVGWECQAILTNCDLKCTIKGPEKILPNKRFTLEISTNKPCKAIIISSPLYHSLSSYFFQMAKEILEKPILRPKHDFPFDSLDGIFEDHIDFVNIEIEDMQKITLKSLKKQGIQEIFCLISDGIFFHEETFSLEVSKPYDIHADIPGSIGIGDCIETYVTYTCNHPNILKISSAVRGEIFCQQVETDGSYKLTLTTPDQFQIQMGDIIAEHSLDAVENMEIMETQLTYLIAGDGWSGEKCTLYPNSLDLIEDITLSLIRETHADTETLAAKLYCSARLYQAHFQQKNFPRARFWERKILNLQEEFSLLAKVFEGNYWGFHLDSKPDKKITEEILHHISIFLEIPKFEEMNRFAKDLREKALNWEICNNRFFSLDSKFQEKKISSPESASFALYHGFQVKKALKYLRKSCKNAPTLHWKGNSLGEAEQTTAFVCRAYHHYGEHDLVKEIWKYFADKIKNGMLSSPAATVAFVELLFEMRFSSPAMIHGEKQYTKRKISETFHVQEGFLWARQDRHSVKAFKISTSSEKFKIKWEGPTPLKIGDEFRIKINTSFIKYPYLQIFIPGNVLLIQETTTYEGKLVWPIPGKKIEFRGKAIREGMGHFHFILKNRYRDEVFLDKYPIVVIA